MRGPIHEAFAEPVERDPAPGLIVPKEPPPAIKETPPDVKPEGENVIWISGYSAWDDDRKDYIWVSGVWRAAPPGQRWTPGYWDAADDGWQWVAGFWSPIEAEEMAFLPDPPASVEAGPTSVAPSDTHFWTPGNWIYDSGYTWRPGYWSAYRPNWVWVNSRYVWTPAGCLFVPGFWDYALAFRGTIFAPVYYSRPIYLQPNYYYTPWCAIPTNNLFMHLWVRPNYNHYYFGDYYGYNQLGWSPWYNTGFNSGYYCPLLSYYRCSYRRQGIDFVGRLRGWNSYFGTHRDLRPPRTWAAQQTFERKHIGRDHLDRIALARPLNQLAKSPDQKLNFVTLANADRAAIAKRADHFRDVTAFRQDAESKVKKSCAPLAVLAALAPQRALVILWMLAPAISPTPRWVAHATLVTCRSAIARPNSPRNLNADRSSCLRATSISRARKSRARQRCWKTLREDGDWKLEMPAPASAPVQRLARQTVSLTVPLAAAGL